MAISSGFAAQNVALELGGKLAGTVSSVQLPGYELAPAAPLLGPGGEQRVSSSVRITPMDAQFSVSEPGVLLDWALSLPRGAAAEQDGAALVTDHNFKLLRRVGWARGLLTELRLPVLDAKDSKKPFQIGLSWQADSVSHQPGGGGAVKPGTSRRKAMLASNFRVKGLPFDGIDIARVELPTIKAEIATEQIGLHRLPTHHYSRLDLGQVTLQGGARSREAALAYVQKVIRDGAITDDEYFDLTVEMLDATMKTVLATLSLRGCGLLRYEEDPVSSAVDRMPAYRLSFSISQFDLKLSVSK